jgi:hypothetical protein
MVERQLDGCGRGRHEQQEQDDHRHMVDRSERPNDPNVPNDQKERVRRGGDTTHTYRAY